MQYTEQFYIFHTSRKAYLDVVGSALGLGSVEVQEADRDGFIVLSGVDDPQAVWFTVVEAGVTRGSERPWSGRERFSAPVNVCDSIKILYICRSH